MEGEGRPVHRHHHLVGLVVDGGAEGRPVRAVIDGVQTHVRGHVGVGEADLVPGAGEGVAHLEPQRLPERAPELGSE